MTKSDLIEELANELNIPSREAKGIVNTILDAMTDTLINGDNIEIRGFGSFTVKQYGSYTGRNPKTCKKTVVKAKKLPIFRVGKELREAVDGGK